MMEAVHISETLANLNVTTWHNIPEDSKLQIFLKYFVIQHETGIYRKICAI
jgi:hypothetical protein